MSRVESRPLRENRNGGLALCEPMGKAEESHKVFKMEGFGREVVVVKLAEDRDVRDLRLKVFVFYYSVHRRHTRGAQSTGARNCMSSVDLKKLSASQQMPKGSNSRQGDLIVQDIRCRLLRRCRK